MRSILHRVLGLVAVAVVPFATGCGEAERELRDDSRTAVSVSTVTVAEGSWPDGPDYSGEVLALRRASPGTVLMGRVERVAVREGDAVEAGATLARIESGQSRAAVAEAEAHTEAARAALHNAELMLRRMERLHERQAASRRDLDDAITGHDAAEAAVRAAEESVNSARAMQDYAEIRAPFSGVVVEKHIEVGDTATPGLPLFVVEDASRVRIEARIPESAASEFAVGDPVTIEAGGTIHETVLSEVVPSADPRSRTFTVRALLDNPERRLRPGSFARLRAARPGVMGLSVPETALVRRGPLTGVFVVAEDDGRTVARLRWITIGGARDGRVEVASGLVAGERVVDAPPPPLEDGRPVEVVQ